ncbi:MULTISPECIES: asparagine synthase-related protein [unclassified Blastococcus]
MTPTPTAAVATGLEAVADLRRLLTRRIERGEVGWVEHGDLAVGWDTRDRFVSSRDDGTVLVVLDGHLHDLFDAERSQAALLLERYRKLGADVAVGLLGDFVAVVLDRARRRLLVCRDPVGVRPWYQASCGRRHSGAGDEATLCALPWVDTAVDEAAALAYLAFVSRSQGPTLHRGITTLAPGCTWSSTAGASAVRRHHTWRIPLRPRLSWEEAVHRCRELVDEAVRCRLRVPDPVGAELSGGLDSSSVVGAMVGLGSPPLVGRLLFEGRTADERGFSQAVIDHWGLADVSVAPWVPGQDELDALTARWRRPVPDANFTMFVSLQRALTGAGRARSLTGLGGDDVFRPMSPASRVVSAAQQRRWDVLRPLLQDSWRDPRGSWRRTWRPTLARLSPRGRPRPPRYVTERAVHEHGLAELFTRPPRVTGVAAVDQRAVNLTTGHTAFLLELRALVTGLTAHRNSHPLLDPRVIEGLYGLDPELPLRDGQLRALQVAAFGDRLPRPVRERRTKAEFSEVFWPQALTHDVLRRVTTGPLVARGWLDLEHFQDVVHGAREKRPSAALPLARAVETDRWLRQAEA